MAARSWLQRDRGSGRSHRVTLCRRRALLHLVARRHCRGPRRVLRRQTGDQRPRADVSALRQVDREARRQRFSCASHRNAPLPWSGRCAQWPASARTRSSYALGKGGSGCGPGTQVTVPHWPYSWGEDAFGLEHAGGPVWEGAFGRGWPPAETSGARAPSMTATHPMPAMEPAAGKRRARVLEQVEQRTSTGTLFSGGTVVIVRQPASAT